MNELFVLQSQHQWIVMCTNYESVSFSQVSFILRNIFTIKNKFITLIKDICKNTHFFRWNGGFSLESLWVMAFSHCLQHVHKTCICLIHLSNGLHYPPFLGIRFSRNRQNAKRVGKHNPNPCLYWLLFTVPLWLLLFYSQSGISHEHSPGLCAKACPTNGLIAIEWRGLINQARHITKQRTWSRFGHF